MKRFGNIWPDFIDKGNAFVAVVDGTKQKRKMPAVQRLFFDDAEVAKNPSCYRVIDPKKAYEYTRPIIESLENGTWQHKKPKHIQKFCRNRTAGKGKWRDLYIASLDDHIVHHMAISSCKKAITRGMHPHCCGSVPGRGIRHVIKFTRHWIKNDPECRYFVKLDIKKYFDNIKADILVEKLAEKIKDPRMLQVLTQIIYSAPIACPVGYYPSPWFANLYLEKLDWFIEQQLYKERRGKRIKYVKHYLRYMDDMLLIGSSKTDLYKAVRAIRKYLKDELDLQIKNTWEIKRIGTMDRKTGKPVSGNWIDIGGYKFCKKATIMRGGIFLAIKQLVRKMYRQGYYTTHQSQSLMSRIGWSSHCDSFRFFTYEIRPFINLKKVRERISYGMAKIR